MSEIYQATVGLDFEGLKPPVRVEAGDPIPKKVTATEIRQLLEDKQIQPVAESEGDE